MSKMNSGLMALRSIAENEVRRTEENLAKANKMVAEAHAQLKTLELYRSDYINRNNKRMMTGISVAELINNQNFMNKLDAAIQAQQLSLDLANSLLMKSKSEWQDSKRKSMSYDVLIRKNEVKQHTIEMKRDQKLMDEFASRSTLNY